MTESNISCLEIRGRTSIICRHQLNPDILIGGTLGLAIEFDSVWPLTCGSACRDIYVELPAKQPPACPPIALTPFVAGQKEDSMAAACRINAPSSPDAEDLANQAKINHLFE
ncbi:unnamed protein product [Dibothriocephalus latus]|uniref:Uncharacterized protein n=1 Tax=Dibothriocephalus latus TaxID=60516 RepID=A0A3P6SLS5_DIBLA|nr:unnamed protein product [Dibothriocephalus latus]